MSRSQRLACLLFFRVRPACLALSFPGLDAHLGRLGAVAKPVGLIARLGLGQAVTERLNSPGLARLYAQGPVE